MSVRQSLPSLKALSWRATGDNAVEVADQRRTARSLSVALCETRFSNRVTRTGFALASEASNHRTHFQMLVEDEAGRELFFDVPQVTGCFPPTDYPNSYVHESLGFIRDHIDCILTTDF